MSQLNLDPPGPRGRKWVTAWTTITAILVCLFIAWAIHVLYDSGQLSPALWKILTNPTFSHFLAGGLVNTLKLAGAATVFSFVLGVAFAYASLSPLVALRAAVRIATELFRGMPLLIMILFIYLGGPVIGIHLSPFMALVIGLTAYNSVSVGEILRGGIQAIGIGQTEAADAIGLGRWKTFRLVLFPQAFQHTLPALIGQLVILLKNSALGFIVGFDDLMSRGNSAISSVGSQSSIPITCAVAAFYIVTNLVLSLIATRVSARLERRNVRAPAVTPEVAEL